MINLETLNPPQKEAVVTTDGPLLVLAGAGSGKTKVLTYRIAFILNTGLAGPQNILAMTFTNKAAGEMKERIAKLLTETNPQDASEQSALPWMGTFHSICVKLLKRHGEVVGLGRNFTIYDSSDQRETVKAAMARLNISVKDFNPGAIHSYISSAKNELVDSETYATYAQGYFQQTVAEVYPMYNEILRENNAVDFDDLLLKTVELFTKAPDILEKYQKQFKYILVDEYQDTNHAQYIIISKLAQEYKNICCVGDDDQSIYAFRGATIKNILNFEKDYPNAKVVKLEQNYRSTKKILEASYQVISKNRGRKDKKLWTDNTDGENIILYTASDEVSEANWITEKISKLAKDMPYNNIAILYRTNAQSRSLEEAFISSAIPYKIVGGLRFYDRKEIKDIISYLRSIYNPKDNKSLERVINVPKRGIGEKTVMTYINQAVAKGQSLLEFLLDSENIIDHPAMGRFSELMKRLKFKSAELSVAQFINYLLEETGYVKMLEDGTLENESRIENLKELISVATKFENDPPLEGLEMFLEEVALLEGASSQKDDELKDYVTLMTIHAAKGLEFEHVFVVGMEENLFPHTNSMLNEAELEEERRLAYVAITRAKQQLYLTHAVKRKYFGITQMNPLSRFAEDINPELVQREMDHSYVKSSSDFEWEDSTFEPDNEWVPNVSLKSGDKVKHEYFGVGKVVKITGTNVVIDFGAIHGQKELMLEYANLQKI